MNQKQDGLVRIFIVHLKIITRTKILIINRKKDRLHVILDSSLVYLLFV
jgi:hypothetical protein